MSKTSISSRSADNEMLRQLKEVQGLDKENRAHIFTTIDAFIIAHKRKAFPHCKY
ncbi:hypothetical protein M3B46_14715 [Sphingobacterium daejeonense]|uniref:hypothetical protein n=1 Tax=Sphingobacterium daejeonense TaxID=371142 RepID=UPI0021A649A6|nr:hypothetical protein [Sphingobacterium daejeonense]MCT1532252.1 hypothetical protein [Sphingobacterium daejeonense]